MLLSERSVDFIELQDNCQISTFPVAFIPQNVAVRMQTGLAKFPHNGMVRRGFLEVVEFAEGGSLKLHVLGIDLGKTVFHLVGLDSTGKVVIRKKCSRTQLLAFTANLRVQLIGMESCGRSHFLGRALREQGHEVRLMPAQYVKPYVQTNKSDFLDAEAIAEAMQRPRMRFVPIKSEEQLDLQALHRVRERWVMRRTAVVNQIRSFLLERGLTLPQGPKLCGSATPQDIRRWRAAAVGLFSRSVGSAQIGTGAAHRTHRGDGPSHSENGERE